MNSLLTDDLPYGSTGFCRYMTFNEAKFSYEQDKPIIVPVLLQERECMPTSKLYELRESVAAARMKIVAPSVAYVDGWGGEANNDRYAKFAAMKVLGL